jgi:F-type H+-transporting ATPase subunit epsilon
MEKELMHLKIRLPFQVFSETQNVSRIVIETSEGSYGLLPQRLDCVAALVPGIITYETKPGGVQYVAVNEGILIKAGTEVHVSVLNATGGADLGKLHELIEKEFMDLDESEQSVRSAMAKMESGFIYSLEKFQKE